jgi:hypothetical protein
MVMQWLDVLFSCLTCVVLQELIFICIVLGLLMLTATRSFFVFSLFWLIKLILGRVNFVTIDGVQVKIIRHDFGTNRREQPHTRCGWIMMLGYSC